MAASVAKMKTMTVVTATSLRVGHVTFDVSLRTSCTNFSGFAICRFSSFRQTSRFAFSLHKTCRLVRGWQEWRDSNPQPPVLETGALPVELHSSSYEIISVTTPDPTVRPPSRIAKRTPLSMAIGAISSISIAMLSPGITISVPSGSLQTPVTSVVLK